MPKVSPEHLDAVCEMDNITLGAAAVNLEKLTGIQVKMIKPKAIETDFKSALDSISAQDKVFLLFKYDEGYGQSFALVFSESDVSVLIEKLSQSLGESLDLEQGLMKVGEQVAQAIGDSLAMLIMNKKITCSPYVVSKEAPSELGDEIVLVEMQFRLNDGQVNSLFWHMLSVDLANGLAADMLGEIDAQLQEFEQKARQDSKEEKKKTEDLISVPDIMAEIRVRLAQKKMLFSELWELGPGAVIEFPQYISQPVDVTMKDKVIAKAQVVTVGENFGVRITEVRDYAKDISSR